MYGFHHPKSIIHQLHLHWSWEWRGITGIETIYDCECSVLTMNILESSDYLKKIVCDTQTQILTLILKFISNPKFATPPQLMISTTVSSCKNKYMTFLSNKIMSLRWVWKLTPMATLCHPSQWNWSHNMHITRSSNGNKLC